jgi:tetratricopeptide (TPR) repeat protein
MSYASSGPASSGDEKAITCNASGMEKFQREEYQEAIKDFYEAIRLNPRNADFYNNLGACYIKLRQPTLAIRAYNKSITLNPDNAFVYNNRGDAKYNLSLYSEAIADYNDAILLNPHEPFFYRNRGDAKYKLGQYSEAILDYDHAISLHYPDLSILYKKRGEANSSLKQYPEALVDFHKADRLDPTINIEINFALSKQTLLDYLMLLPIDESKPLLREYLDKTTALGKMIWECKGGIRQMLAYLTQNHSDPELLKIKYTFYLEAVAYIENAIHSQTSPSCLFLTRFLSAYPFQEYDSHLDFPHESIDETLRACIQGRSRLKNFIVDLDNKKQKKASQFFITQHKVSDQLPDIQPQKIKPTFNLDQLKLKAEENSVVALCQLAQHFIDKRTRMAKLSSKATLTMFANREHSHFTAENFWMQLLYTMTDDTLSQKERKEITLLAEKGNAAAKLLLIQEIITQKSSSPRERLQAQTDLTKVMQWGGKVFDGVCEKIYEDQSYVTPEFFACLEKAGCFEDLPASASKPQKR